MRDFLEIQRELKLMKLTDSVNGTLYCVPVAPGAPRLVVRRFDGALPPSLVEDYEGLHVAAARWLAADPVLDRLVRLQSSAEIGRDYIAHHHWNATSLERFLTSDPEEDPPEPPPELSPMQARFRERLERITTQREALLAALLGRSILAPASKTFYDEASEQFVIAELSPTSEEVERWRALDT
jgi:hypothetical protein